MSGRYSNFFPESLFTRRLNSTSSAILPCFIVSPLSLSVLDRKYRDFSVALVSKSPAISNASLLNTMFIPQQFLTSTGTSDLNHLVHPINQSSSRGNQSAISSNDSNALITAQLHFGSSITSSSINAMISPSEFFIPMFRHSDRPHSPVLCITFPLIPLDLIASFT